MGWLAIASLTLIIYAIISIIMTGTMSNLYILPNNLSVWAWGYEWNMRDMMHIRRVNGKYRGCPNGNCIGSRVLVGKWWFTMKLWGSPLRTNPNFAGQNQESNWKILGIYKYRCYSFNAFLIEIMMTKDQNVPDKHK